MGPIENSDCNMLCEQKDIAERLKQSISQNNILRSIFKNCLTPPIGTVQALTGIPPIYTFCQSLAVKYLFETKQKENDLIQVVHNQTLTQNCSSSGVLESFWRRHRKVTNTTEILVTPLSRYPHI